jgi:hypothetical protein
LGRKSREKRVRRQRAQQVDAASRAATAARASYKPNADYFRAADGLTDSERYLTALSDRTFLSLWSYPNPTRDQGSGQKGKEICDLLVFFEKHVVIFSDKHCEFPDSGDLDLDWARWYRRAVETSARQLWGAERWIKSYPNRVFLDVNCERRFPFPLAPTSELSFHRIVVAHGASARCKKELGGSGSLMISSSLVGDAHMLPRDKGGFPFMVGSIDPTKGYVHVLDDTTLDILLRTLDTVADFVGYLNKKEKLFQSGRMITAAGEEELLAYYLTHLNADGEYDFVFDERFNGVSLDEGFWSSFESSEERMRQIMANEISYYWDDIIERSTKHFLKGTAQFMSDPTLTSHELILRFFAREPRVRRRMLSSAIVEMIRTTGPNMRRLRVMAPSRPSDPYFVLLAFPEHKDVSYELNRDVRRGFLEACCGVVKLDFPEALDVVGFATETVDAEGRSEDYAYFDARDWTEEDAEQARRDKKALNILTRATRIEDTEYDYPEPNPN